MLLASVIVADFSLPGMVHTVKVNHVEVEQQNYRNAGGNSHHSYQIHTDQLSFYASEDFAESLTESDSIKLHTSLLFHEVNRHAHLNNGKSHVYSLRWFSGLIIPLAVLVVLLMGLRNKKRVGIWVYIAQILLVADLVFIFW